MQLEGNYVDSHGQSEIGFAITSLLNFDLLARIKRINKIKLYGPDQEAFPRLAPAMTRAIRWDLIEMIKFRHSHQGGHGLGRGDPAPLHPQRHPGWGIRRYVLGRYRGVSEDRLARVCERPRGPHPRAPLPAGNLRDRARRLRPSHRRDQVS